VSTPSAAAKLRPYEDILRGMGVDGDRATRMQKLVDLLWDRLAATGVSWIGFYSKAPGRDEMILEARRDKPACSPIGLHGACGRSWKSRRSLIVTDVSRLGAGYIACDPRDRSEAVVPLFEDNGTCWGVLDVDSYKVGAFTGEDAEGLARIVTAAGLSAREPVSVEVI
jgi:putative methionine-R-sulfoxide reductase with GAF domain